MLYSQSLEPGNLTIINCQHSCDPSIYDINQYHPTLTIQIPNDYAPHDLHSRRLVDTFLSIYDLTSQISLRYFQNDTCGNDSLRHFGLEISDINTNRLNNSVIHCGVVSSEFECVYRGEGIIFLRMPPLQPPMLPTGNVSTSPIPTLPSTCFSSSQPSSVLCGTSYILYYFLYYYLSQ